MGISPSLPAVGVLLVTIAVTGAVRRTGQSIDVLFQRHDFSIVRPEDAYRTVIEIKRRVLGADNAEVVALKQHVDRLARTSNGSADRHGEKDYTDRG